MPTRLQIAAPDIINLFNSAPTKVFSGKEIAAILSEHRHEWRLAQATSVAAFIDFLLDRGLKKRILRSTEYSPITKYTWGEVSSFELGQTLRPNSYLSHGTAVFLHGLTDQFPSVIYSNREQSEKPRSRGELSQQGIDRAFRSKQRQSAYVYNEGRWRYTLLSGKQTQQLEVGRLRGPNEETLAVTKLERTLIDVVVRPTYAGGIFEVKAAFERAKDRVSTNVLLATLKKLDYVYPYHQAIGFYMDRAGFSAEALDLVARIGFEFDFYLAHGTDNVAYDDRWRLFHPQGF